MLSQLKVTLSLIEVSTSLPLLFLPYVLCLLCSGWAENNITNNQMINRIPFVMIICPFLYLYSLQYIHQCSICAFARECLFSLSERQFIHSLIHSVSWLVISLSLHFPFLSLLPGSLQSSLSSPLNPSSPTPPLSP